MSGGEAGSERATALEERLRRFATLRRAERALAPSILDLQMEHSEARTRAFREHLETVSQLAGGPSSEETFRYALQDVDRTLDEHAERLRGLADGVTLSQLRATLPGIAERHPEEALALLHLWIEDEPGLAARVAPIEYLITLLATSEEAGRRRLSVDPARLSPEVSRFCDALGERYEGPVQELERTFHQVAARLDDAADTGRLARQLREHKEALGVDRFVPGLLRAIVACNIQLANRMQARLVAERSLDEDLGVPYAMSAGAGERGAGPAGPHPRHSVFEDEGIRLVLEALRRRLRGTAIGSCTSESLALALDLGELDPAEREVCADEPSDGEQRLLACAVVVGLLARQRGAHESALRELKIDLDLLADAWPRELDARMRDAIQAHLAANRYEQSCRLSDTRTKFLYTPVSAGAERPAPAVRAREGDALLARAAAATAPAPGPLPAPSRRRSPGAAEEERRSPAWRLPALAAAVLIAFALLGTNLVSLGEGGAVRELGHHELAKVSGQLVAAYRSREGTGGLVVGRVGISWRGLDDAEQYETAQSLSMRLAGAGVDRILVYDPRQQLVVDYAGGRLRVPSPPSE